MQKQSLKYFIQLSKTSPKLAKAMLDLDLAIIKSNKLTDELLATIKEANRTYVMGKKGWLVEKGYIK